MKIAVIGGGPAGIIAAGSASSLGNDVYLLEKNNKIGKKLYITGKGRCNITNGIDIGEFFDYIITNGSFLYSSLYSFTNDSIIDLLSKYRVETMEERGSRIFPISNKSSDVIRAFGDYLKDSGVNLLLNTEVKDIDLIDGKFHLQTQKETMIFDKVILATGGASYPLTGSTGDGYKFARKLGHKIVEAKASLVPIELNERWLKELQGLSLKNISLKTFSNKKLVHEEFGEMIFTHFGISGPIVLRTSSYLHRYKNLRFEIDFKPALTYEKLDQRILRDFKEEANKQFKNSLSKLLPTRLIPLIVDNSNINGDKIVHQITREEREKLISSLKSFPLKFKSLRSLSEAIITSGGIDTREINSSTMESKLVKNLYFAGELIDVDALTGGFNLQIAYSTGYLAGSNL